MNISIVYALPQEQHLEDMDVPDGTTVAQALQTSQLLQRHPDLNLDEHKLGIYGKLIKPEQVLFENDRIEVYRSLPRKPRNAHASDDKKARIRAKKTRQASETT